jgi:hypothetical protein
LVVIAGVEIRQKHTIFGKTMVLGAPLKQSRPQYTAMTRANIK